MDLALVYTRYAVAHPALYELMFARTCGDDDELLAAAADVFALIETVVANVAPQTSPRGRATAGWALAHGMASLHLDGKLGAHTSGDLDARVREAFVAINA